MIIHWPGKVPKNKTSDTQWYFADFLPTAATLAGAQLPDNIDGINLLPTLLGKENQLTERFLYWEFFEKDFQQAVRWNQWKAIRLKPGEPLLLFDLSKDLGEENNVAGEYPEVIEEMETYLKMARTESVNWPLL
jgi:arylsulfatase A-like enzyme